MQTILKALVVTFLITLAGELGEVISLPPCLASRDDIEYASQMFSPLNFSRGREDFFFRRLSTLPQLKRLLNRAVALPMISAIAVIFISLVIANYVRTTQHWVDHSTEVIKKIQVMRMSAREAQTNLREFWLGEDGALPQKSATQQKVFEETYHEVKSLISNNPEQMKRLDQLSHDFAEWVKFAKEFTDSHAKSANRRADYLKLSAQEKSLADTTMKSSNVIIELERNIRMERTDQTKMVAVILIASIALLVLLLAAVVSIFSRSALIEVSSSYGRALESEKRAKETAEKAVATRDDFLSVASHELKTPLTALKLQLQLIERKGAAKESNRPGFDVAFRQINSLNALVDDLLDTSRINAGRLTLNIDNVDLSSAVQDVVSRFAEQLKEVESPVRLELENNIVGHWDVRRIEQIVANLISNAIKYAPRSPVHVVARRSGNLAVLVVEDFGPGIPKDKQAFIFNRFERAHNNTGVSGLGLGLFIVKNIVDQTGGAIRVESADGKGTKFIVELPL